MAQVTFDPDDVNQDRSILLADGRRVAIAELAPDEVVAAIRQCWTLRSAYAEARVAAHPAHARADHDQLDLSGTPLLAALERRRAEQRRERASRSADSLPAADLFQDATWTSRNGTTRALNLLSPSHRRSVLGWLERNATALADRIDPDRSRIPRIDPLDWVRETPLHRRLTELVAAQTGKDEAKDRARQIARRAHFEATGEWPEEPPVRTGA